MVFTFMILIKRMHSFYVKTLYNYEYLGVNKVYRMKIKTINQNSWYFVTIKLQTIQKIIYVNKNVILLKMS